MQTERRRLINRMLESLVELPPDEQVKYLEEARLTDLSLEREIYELIQEYRCLSGFLEQPMVRLAVPEVEDLTDQKIGAYRVLERLGSGGMGEVWLAMRDDGQFKKRVALKILPSGRTAGDLAARFLKERQILAHLKHPHIAELYDGGMTSDGRPYFVMEYVEGLPIDRFCKKGSLSIQDRIRLFRKICDAVRYAHANLVIHRDLKPGNILVTSDGEPKLLDFGIAKPLGIESRNEPSHTVTGMRPMTPEYASPEQIRGEPLKTATDIYALGTLLFYLLTDCHPFQAQQTNTNDLLKRICETEPPKPSQTARAPSQTGKRPDKATKKLRRILSGDLDQVVLKALRKEPDRRYESVAQLSEDLRRYLAQQPVLARKETLFYLTGKFVRRNKLLVVSFFLAFLLPVSFGVAHMLEQRQTLIQKDRAEKISEYLIEIFAGSDPWVAKQEPPTVRELLEKAVSSMDQEPESEPELWSAIHVTLGRVYLNLGDFAQAQNLLQRSLDLVQKVPGNRNLEKARILFLMGKAALRREGPEKARPHYEKALSLLNPHGNDDPRLTANIFHGLGSVEINLGRFSEAEERFKSSLNLLRELAPNETAMIGTSYGNLGSLYREMGQFERAATFHRKALEHFKESRGTKDPLYAMGLGTLGLDFHRLGRFEESESTFFQALALFEEILGPSHPHVMNTWSNLGSLYKDRSEPDCAAYYLRKSIDLCRSLSIEEPHFFATTWDNLGQVLRQKKDYPGAMQCFEKALEIQKEQLGPIHPFIAITTHNIGTIYEELGMLDQAHLYLNRALGLYRQTLGADHPFNAASLVRLGIICTREGNAEAAAGFFENALETVENKVAENHRYNTNALLGLAALYQETGDPERALIYCQRLIAIEKKTGLATRMAWRETAERYARILSDLGRTGEAKAWLTENKIVEPEDF